MNVVAIEPLPRNVVAPELLPKTPESLRAFVGLPTKTAKPADTTVADLFARIAQVTDAMFVAILEKRTAAEFRGTAISFYNDYVHVMRAKADLLRVVCRNDLSRMEPLVHQGISELEADFRAVGADRFGAAVAQQALFTTWLLRRTANHIWQIHEPDETQLDAGRREGLDKLASEFGLHASWAQLHLGCLTAAMRLDKPLYPDAIPAMMDGLRSMVNADALSRQILEVFSPSVEDATVVPYAWDAEDEELMQSSMRDIASDDEDDEAYGDSAG